MYCKTILFLVIDATLASDNSDIFQKEYQKKKVMATDDKIRDEISQDSFNRQATKISSLYEYLTGKEILTFNQIF